MEKSTYKAAGVDIHAGYEVVRRIKKHVESTFRPEVLSGIAVLAPSLPWMPASTGTCHGGRY